MLELHNNSDNKKLSKPKLSKPIPNDDSRVNHRQPLHYSISHTLKRLGISPQVESGEPFTAERNLRMDSVIRRGSLRDAPNREYRDTSILLDGRYTYEEVVLITMVQRPLPPRRANVNNVLVRDMCPSTNEATNLPL